MKVDRNITVRELNNSFVKIYPYLKIKVYRKFHNPNQGSPSSEEIEEEVFLKDINEKLQSGEIVISDSLSVDNLEMIFRKKFGLSVQVFRKSGDQWLQTTTTDKWTLERQNKSGKEYEQFLKEKNG